MTSTRSCRPRAFSIASLVIRIAAPFLLPRSPDGSDSCAKAARPGRRTELNYTVSEHALLKYICQAESRLADSPKRSLDSALWLMHSSGAMRKPRTGRRGPMKFYWHNPPRADTGGTIERFFQGRAYSREVGPHGLLT